MKPSFELVASIIDELIEDTDYGNIYDYVFDGASDISCWFYEVENYTHFEMAHGYTKIVIESDRLGDWVLKIPILNGKRKDFCAIEAANYKAACEAGLERFFAPTFFFAEISNIPVYIQKKVYCCNGDVSDNFYDWTARQMEGSRYEYDTDDEFDDAVYEEASNLTTQSSLRAMFEETNDLEDIDKLYCFCNKFHINDLHSGNYGFDNGRAVIIDFSGF